MKKLLLSTVLAAFAVAVQAGDAKPAKDTAQSKPACCAKKAASETKAECPMMSSQAKAECPMAGQAKATSCPMAKKAAQTATIKSPLAKRFALLSPKAMDLATR